MFSLLRGETAHQSAVHWQSLSKAQWEAGVVAQDCWVGGGGECQAIAMNPGCSFLISVNLDGSLNLAGAMLLSWYV